MAVRANSRRLQSRVDKYTKILKPAALAGMHTAAGETIDEVQAQTRTQWQDDEYQVGFDVDSFASSIREVETLEDDGYGIMNVERMGTAADFEEIGIGSGLWHDGGHRGDAFRRFVLERPGQKEALAQLRKAVWGDKNPQWWFFENGNEAFQGAFPQRPGTFVIRTTLIKASRKVRRTVENSVNELLRQSGVL